jgi:hypothetical protein
MKGIGNRQKKFLAAKRVWAKSPSSPKSKDRRKPTKRSGKHSGHYIRSDIKKS